MRGINLTKYVCWCPRILRMAPSTYEKGYITCPLCSHPFEPAEHEPQLGRG